MSYDTIKRSMASQYVIAVLMDCDDTLCDDSTNYLISRIGIDPEKEFWPLVTPKIEKGWDPPLAYMTELIRICRERGNDLTLTILSETGREIEFYEGVPSVFNELRGEVERVAEEYGLRIDLEFYVISSGFEEILASSSIAPPVTDEVFGCTFEFDEEGKAIGARSIVTFTEKTKFLYAINKGIVKSELRRNPGSVNNAIDEKDRRIPIRNMIYIGDGPTDIPCFSTVMKGEGKVVGIRKPQRPERGAPLWKGKRLTVGPYNPVYTKGSDLRTTLTDLVLDVAADINTRSKIRYVP
jgi:hypothetical protein